MTKEEIKAKEPKYIIYDVKSWKNTDTYPCPFCDAKLAMPFYYCEPCNIEIKPVINFSK